MHISPEGCFVAAGFHMPEPQQLNAIRRAIKDKPAKFKAAAAALAKAGLPLSANDRLTRVPRGFEDLKGGPLEDAVRLKSFIVEEPIPDRLITTPKLAASVETFAGRALPLLKFGWEALG